MYDANGHFAAVHSHNELRRAAVHLVGICCSSSSSSQRSHCPFDPNIKFVLCYSTMRLWVTEAI
jgi:hypothetical protein